MNKTLTAIVIDDDKDVLDLFSEYLKIIQVEVVGKGNNGKKAVELYQEKNPDITFVDLAMPEYDGIFALQNIRKIDPKANVIIITGNLQKDASEKLDYLNPDKILQKPFEVDKITDAINKIRNSK
ncbi:MAG: response regulator [Nitrososphaerales archaeon]|jgi:DNA-binding NarL/FixJ family response regulator